MKIIIAGHISNDFYEFKLSPPEWIDLSNNTKGDLLPSTYCHSLHEIEGSLLALMSSVDDMQPTIAGEVSVLI